MKQIPNMISIFRIILSIALLFFFQQPIVFFALYLLSGVSDLIDGVLARAINAESELGAKLDSVGDFFLFTIMMIYVVFFFGNDIKEYIPMIAIVFAIRTGALTFAFYKFHTFVMLHTWSNKITGAIIFFTPLLLLLNAPIIIYFVLTIAVLSAVEELIIHIISDQPDLNRKGLFK